MNITTKDHIHCDDTVFAVETRNDGTRQVHIFGYGYCAGSNDIKGKDYRFVEYLFCYAPLDEVLRDGLSVVEERYAPTVKQLITDCTFIEMMHIYKHYHHGRCPTPITAFDASIPDGSYILVNQEA